MEIEGSSEEELQLKIDSSLSKLQIELNNYQTSVLSKADSYETKSQNLNNQAQNQITKFTEKVSLTLVEL